MRKAPAFTAKDMAGEEITSTELAGQLFGMLFVKAECPLCEQAVLNLEPVNRRAGDNVFIVCKDSPERCRRLTSGTPETVRVLVDSEGELTDAFDVTSFPMAIVVNKDGRVQAQGQIVEGQELEEILKEEAASASASGGAR
jgi:peroxiredoxin